MRQPVRQNMTRARRRGVLLLDLLETLKQYTASTHVFAIARPSFIGESVVDDTYYIHFSDVEKLGIYPRSAYGTPVGIYAYPLISAILMKLDAGRIPFAADRKYIVLFRARRAPLVYTHGDIDRIVYEDLFNATLDQAVLRFPSRALTTWETILRSVERTARFPGSYIGRLWNVTRIAAQGNSRRWNTILRAIGIAGVIDNAGMGLIHQNEPMQAVFFSRGVIKVVDIFDNKLTPMHIQTRRVQSLAQEFRGERLREALALLYYADNVLTRGEPFSVYDLHKAYEEICGGICDDTIVEAILVAAQRMHLVSDDRSTVSFRIRSLRLTEEGDSAIVENMDWIERHIAYCKDQVARRKGL